MITKNETKTMSLSIITINYNNREGLQRTIDSVLAQTWKDFEWIVIDGGSTDGSRELIEQYQEYFAYWCSEPDKGVYNAMNKGIAKAHGEYLNFMNSGDTFYEAETLKKVFGEPRSADILYGDWEEISPSHSCIKHFPEPVELYSFYCMNICHQAMFIRRAWLDSKGYDESFRIYADWKRWVELAIDGASFRFVGIPVCKYDMTGISQKSTELCKKEAGQLSLQFPDAIKCSLKHLNSYAGSRHTVRAKKLIERGGISALLTKICLACLDKIFIRIDFSNYPYCD